MYLFFNNKFYETTEPIILADSKAFRYGELAFETIRYCNNTLYFLENHYNRLQKIAALLQFQFPKYFTEKILELHILSLVKKNNVEAARIRVTIFKGNGGIFENEEQAFNILIESYPLPQTKYELNSNGLDVCFFEEIKKTQDVYSNYKTGNHLIYNMAGLFAKKQKCNEAIILNVQNNICDSTISSIFIIKDHKIFTPSLTEGCIDGIMRNYILKNELTIIEKAISKEEILQADAVFLTNTIRGIQWVKQIENKKFELGQTASLFEKIIVPINKP